MPRVNQSTAKYQLMRVSEGEELDACIAVTHGASRRYKLLATNGG
jgi:hypothetical protein